MTTLAQLDLTELPDHLVLYGVDWDFYEHLLEQIGDRALRVTFDDGDLEIMSPLPDHEYVSRFIARLIQTLALELDIPIRTQGSTTYRKRRKKKGLEPDECFYVQNELKLRGKRTFDATKFPPDLAVEVGVTHRSILRMPVYAGLGVREVWRHDRKRLGALKLEAREYVPIEMSIAFPFLKVSELNRFIDMSMTESETDAIRAFQQWVRKRWGEQTR